MGEARSRSHLSRPARRNARESRRDRLRGRPRLRISPQRGSEQGGVVGDPRGDHSQEVVPDDSRPNAWRRGNLARLDWRNSKGRARIGAARKGLHDSHGRSAAVSTHRAHPHPHPCGQTLAVRSSMARCRMPASSAPSLRSIALLFAKISATSFGGGQKASIRHEVLAQRLDALRRVYGRARDRAGTPGPEHPQSRDLLRSAGARRSRRARGVRGREPSAVRHRAGRRRALLSSSPPIRSCTARCAAARPARSA